MGRAQFRRLLSNSAHNHHRLLYELALTSAQIAQVDNFELMVPAQQGMPEDTNGSENMWLTVTPGEEPGSVKLRKYRKHRKPPVHILKLVDCDETLFGTSQ